MPERADAARNRAAILAAAERLLSEHDPADVSIEDIARAAGVGKGTVFHRFGSRTALMRELVEERAKTLLDAMADGPPPLGPGAPAAERLIAFFDAVMVLATRNIGLIAAYEQAEEGGRQASDVYQRWHRHVGGLIAAARPDLDADLMAHILLGSLHSDLVIHLIRRGETGRLRKTLHQLVFALLAGGGKLVG
ncbi:TetR/AcrR family transcriptional regulator [Actinocrispum wychmicini]|uniref:TetR family transcriptional regulator n=1 Tax=Actinocrispum wychmicini TaxID=1213861 RepID=A0A4R2K1A8_9PSEU|nr:TetR/AcrR family transcriptional regulator [Actinocrispum wychmicini]TCO65477.1 TetR family transcriptional regulator [Actinocrispum wychmicini]